MYLFTNLLVLASALLVDPTNGHVALTFPPARRYDLDFLDSSRTKAPCGMPKGNIKTSLLAGSKLNVTWHLGYPHRGGFKIQLLDQLERPVLDLTPSIQGSEFVAEDATAQAFQVQLPTDFTCENCTVRLIRQALEWGANYKFWSCADVDIKPRKTFRESCSGHGRYLLGRCKCDRLYYGSSCQYRDECWEDSDCGDHGKCIDVQATTAPKQQCYCQLGWFGPGCNKRSPVKTTEIDFDLYTERKLSDTFRLYWRILKEHKELEAVLVVNGTSYAALGWRPRSLTKSCKNFPLIGNVQESEAKAEPEPEPKTEPEPEPKAEPEPEPEPSSEPEPTTEPPTTQKPKYRKSLYSRRSTQPQPQPQADVVETSVSFQVSRKQSRARRAASETLNAYTPRHDFNPMDCTDIVIGSARGTASRIADYYTRDRSTPRMDSFYGGKNDLTAAMGFEKDGVTTILFRKKLEAKEASDHTIEEDLMHIIWAQGQEQGKYIHVPKSGVETAKASVKDFYKPDELKYHGHGAQRGTVSLNFFEERKMVLPAGAGATSPTAENTECGGEWRLPRSCNPENYTCEYSAKWELLPKRDEIHFTITTSNTDTWTGIAFSNDEKMSQTDAILGWVDKTGRPFLMDTWINGYTQPSLDSNQNIYNASGKIINGVTTLSFTRKRITNDPKDLSFTNDQCLYVMFPVKGGAFNSVNKKIRKHEVVPSISTDRICIRSCGNDDIYDYMTTTEAPGLDYKVEVKIKDLGDNFVLPKEGTLQYDDLTNMIGDNFKPLFKKLAGYRRMTIEEVKEDNNNIIASMVVNLDKAAAEKGRALSGDEEGNDEHVHRVLQESVGSGKVGNLKVDPQYLVFEPQSLTSNVVPDASTDQGFFNLSEAKLYIVLGCIAALVLVAIVQASCTIYKASSRGSSNHKDHLIPNSAWKDYSANTNYAFDAFEAEEKKVNGKGNRSETLPSKHNRVQRPQGRPPAVPQQYMGDTRSLQRPRGAYPTNNLERSTFSLPRTAYDRHRPPQDMQPDFYFMPSQRKYSGEVVRVYVDYNNQPK